MRTYSSLRGVCAYPELIDLAIPPSKARQTSMDLGTEFHVAVEAWVKGTPMPVLTSKDARAWLARMEKVWAPPPGCEAEIATGITDDGRGVYVDEPEPHVYVPRDPADRLVTAGRLDLRWTENVATRVVVDVKTGRTYLGDPWAIPQLAAQAVSEALLCRVDDAFDDVSEIRLGVYYARTGLFDFPPARPLYEVIDELLPQVKAWATMPADPNPGAWCLGCYSRANCASDPTKGVAA